MMTIKQHFDVIRWSLKTAWGINKSYAFWKLFSNILSQFSTIISSYYLAFLINSLTSSEGVSTSEMVIYTLIYLGIQLSTIVVQHMSEIFTFSFTSQGVWKLDRKLYTALNNIPLAVVESPEFNNHYMRATEAKMTIIESFNKIVDIIGSITRVVSITIILFPSYPLQVIALFAFVLPRYMIVGGALQDVLRYTIGETENRKRNTLSVGALRVLSNQIEIRITGAFEFLDQKVDGYFSKYFETEANLQSKRAFWAALLTFLQVLVIGWVLYIAIQRYDLGLIQIGSIAFLLTNMQSLSWGLNSIVAVMTALFEMNVKSSDFKRITDIEIESKAKKSSQEYANRLKISKSKISQSSPARIEIKDLSFSYPSSEKLVLKDVNLTIEPGEKIAIVGHNGAGKTTLIKLLFKLYSIEKGTIHINGISLDKIPGSFWYGHISGLMQKYNIYAGLTVQENVYLGNSKQKVQAERIADSLEKAELMDDIKILPNGIETYLSPSFKGGTDLSSGQAQKLAIARFLYSEAPIVVFDEPTASIDAVSEAKIFGNIFDSLQDKTVIIISHRFSTVRRANRIIVFDHGTIVEQGTHDDLIELGGTYARSYELQAEGYKDKKQKLTQ